MTNQDDGLLVDDGLLLLSQYGLLWSYKSKCRNKNHVAKHDCGGTKPL